MKFSTPEGFSLDAFMASCLAIGIHLADDAANRVLDGSVIVTGSEIEVRGVNDRVKIAIIKDIARSQDLVEVRF